MSSEARESETGAKGRASRPIKLNENERHLLRTCCRCDDEKGVPVAREWRRVAASLTRKGLAWTMSSVFMVCIATDEGRAFIKQEGR